MYIFDPWMFCVPLNPWYKMSNDDINTPWLVFCTLTFQTEEERGMMFIIRTSALFAFSSSLIKRKLFKSHKHTRSDFYIFFVTRFSHTFTRFSHTFTLFPAVSHRFSLVLFFTRYLLSNPPISSAIGSIQGETSLLCTLIGYPECQSFSSLASTCAFSPLLPFLIFRLCAEKQSPLDILHIYSSLVLQHVYTSV